MTDGAPKRIWAWITGIQPLQGNAGLWRSDEGTITDDEYILAACVPTVDRADCTDGATWRAACDRDRAAVERPEPEPGGHWATRDNEPDSRVDPEGHRDWQRDRDAQREEGTW